MKKFRVQAEYKQLCRNERIKNMKGYFSFDTEALSVEDVITNIMRDWFYEGCPIKLESLNIFETYDRT